MVDKQVIQSLFFSESALLSTMEENKERIKEFYDVYANKLLAYTRKNYRINEDDVWTVVYKTIYRMAAVSHKYTFETPGKQNAFVFKTHINYLRNYFRDNKSFESNHLEVELYDYPETNSDEQIQPVNPVMVIMQQELDKLEDWQRILLLMRGQDMPYSEIAAFVNKPEKQLKVYYGRLKQHLLEIVNAQLTALKLEVNEK